MKRISYFVIILLLYFSTNVFGFGDYTLQLIDASSRNPISNAYVSIEDHYNKQSRFIGKTDFNGKVNLGIHHLDFTLFIDAGNNYTGLIKSTGFNLNSNNLIIEQLYRKGSENKQYANELEETLNKILKLKGFGELSYKISSAILKGKDVISIGSSALNSLPKSGILISLPGLWESNYVIKNGKLMIELKGRLVDSILNFTTRVLPGSERYLGSSSSQSF